MSQCKGIHNYVPRRIINTGRISKHRDIPKQKCKILQEFIDKAVIYGKKWIKGRKKELQMKMKTNTICMQKSCSIKG